MSSGSERLRDDNARGFDALAGGYDEMAGEGVNAVFDAFRSVVRGILLERFPRGGRLADIGCGTGLDLVAMVERGYDVTGVEPSAKMAGITRARIDGLPGGLRSHGRVVEAPASRLFEAIGAPPVPVLDGAYSNLGPLNAEPDLGAVALGLRATLKPGAFFVASPMSLLCPWEIVWHALTGRPREALRRLRPGMSPVRADAGEHIWTAYYTPDTFLRPFQRDFALVDQRGLGAILPPPYLSRQLERSARAARWLTRADEIVGRFAASAWASDHFVVVLQRR